VCDNGIFCDGAEICDPASGCEPGESVDCSGLDDLCNQGICDEAAGSCATSPLPTGTACDDGDDCT
jgi:hypothetical protein